ncbi:MAG: AmmeMemoRadiSam system protein B [Gammaproteobacteria bacterium]|nr:AmmeMemoRadiSam system protein B [Gammaproteobacteria bacterium]MCP5198316.1 AmmeMemoRadiSam system protein B [Gammaproteobacteria bacterium]
MQTTRTPAVAGLFYPASAAELHAQIQAFLNQVQPMAGPPPKAIIAPHAGYVYSGPIAASAYARIKAISEIVTRVVLLGPSHRVGFRGIAVSSMQAFATPLGLVPVDQEAIEQIRQLPDVSFLEQAHTQEHSLEVHLPFLQEVLGPFKLVPLVVGDARPQQVGTILEVLWGGPETLIVISSDLSHYHDYQTARYLDSETSKAIETLRFQDIGYEQACGRNPVNGLLWVAQRKDLHGETLDLRNSGDTAGSRDQVVGYGAYAFH